MSLPSGATGARRVGGGDINEAWRVTLADGATAFVKTRADAGPGEYTAEADGLAWLAEPGALRTPRVIEVGEDYLALEWIEPSRLDAAGTEELGRGLAATHAAGAADFGDPRLGGSGASAPSRLWLAAPAQRADRAIGPPSTPSDACDRWRRSPTSAAPCRIRESAQSSGCVRGSPSWRVRPSLRRGCTETCGVAT